MPKTGVRLCITKINAFPHFKSLEYSGPYWPVSTIMVSSQNQGTIWGSWDTTGPSYTHTKPSVSKGWCTLWVERALNCPLVSTVSKGWVLTFCFFSRSPHVPITLRIQFWQRFVLIWAVKGKRGEVMRFKSLGLCTGTFHSKFHPGHDFSLRL